MTGGKKMAIWILAIVIGLLVIAGAVVTVNLVMANQEAEPEIIDCKSCGNSCNRERNCGLQSCGGVSGGSCGCGS